MYTSTVLKRLLGTCTGVARSWVPIGFRSRKQAVVYAIRSTLYVAHVFLDTMFWPPLPCIPLPDHLCSRSAGGSRSLHPGRQHHRECKIAYLHYSTVVLSNTYTRWAGLAYLPRTRRSIIIGMYSLNFALVAAQTVLRPDAPGFASGRFLPLDLPLTSYSRLWCLYRCRL